MCYDIAYTNAYARRLYIYCVHFCGMNKLFFNLIDSKPQEFGARIYRYYYPSHWIADYAS